MTKHFVTADPVAWEHAFTRFKLAKGECDGLEKFTDEVTLKKTVDRLYEAEVILLAMPAPSIAAIIDKLSILWSDEISYELEESRQKRIIIGDLRRMQISINLIQDHNK